MDTQVKELQKQNEELKRELEIYKSQLSSKPQHRPSSAKSNDTTLPGKDTHVSIVVIGASGDLAKKKTFPAMFALYGLGLLPPNVSIFGFARTALSQEDFKKQIVGYFKGWDDKKQAFLDLCHYSSGQYNSAESFAELAKLMATKEGKLPGHRVFYLAIPPNIFVEVADAVKKSATSPTGFTRLIVEKPFGRDSQTSAVLSKQLSALFEEDQLYRIDHYLGKEMVQNLMALRFANIVFEPVWNRNYISSVHITFKEDIGTEGRGGYFDPFGIIRDVMQNHLTQILALVAMEPPVSLSAEDVRDEKVKVLRACRSAKLSDVVLGQYGKDKTGKVQGYLDDPTVPKGSITPTFASAVIHIENTRWRGVPFILKCGKGLNDRKAEIRVQFKNTPNRIFHHAPRDELVIRVQPNEAVYMKFNAKEPGLAADVVQTELDLTYKSRFDVRLPDAYERLIYDVLRGDHNLFVRVDELEAAWDIFTPLLHKLEKEKIVPEVYPFGSRGPAQADELAARYGFKRSEDYKWTDPTKKSNL